jgi:hypothetical protein
VSRTPAGSSTRSPRRRTSRIPHRRHGGPAAE